MKNLPNLPRTESDVADFESLLDEDRAALGIVIGSVAVNSGDATCNAQGEAASPLSGHSVKPAAMANLSSLCVPLIRLKVGRDVVDPNGRHVTVVSVGTGMNPDVTVRLGGSYAATVTYPASCLRNVP
jgi:hypothetical protein